MARKRHRDRPRTTGAPPGAGARPVTTLLRGDWPADASQVATVAEHQQRILAEVEQLPVVSLPLMDVVGLPLARDVTAPLSLPRFDNSGMDGYAVRRADVAGAAEDTPVVLPVVGEIGAGQADLRVLSGGAAAKIMTGAPVPSGADAVVPYEWTDRGSAHVTVTRAPADGQHVRRAGEDVLEGDLLLEAGTVLGPRQVGLLAAVGIGEAAVRPRPRVVVISTGTELREPGEDLGHDSIFDGNSYLLAAAVNRAGAVADRVGIVPDDPDSFTAALHAQLEHADAIITSGGVSQGDWDVVKQALRPQGVWFGPVAMQPGRPQGFGLLGERRVPIFTLPGNPVSAYVSFEVFVLPALRAMTGRTPHARPVMQARLERAVTSPAGKAQYLRGIVALDRQGEPYVAPVGGPGSHLVGELAAANCLIAVPAEADALAAGTAVGVLLLDEDY